MLSYLLCFHWEVTERPVVEVALACAFFIRTVTTTNVSDTMSVLWFCIKALPGGLIAVVRVVVWVLWFCLNELPKAMVAVISALIRVLWVCVKVFADGLAVLMPFLVWLLWSFAKAFPKAVVDVSSQALVPAIWVGIKASPTAAVSATRAVIWMLWAFPKAFPKALIAVVRAAILVVRISANSISTSAGIDQGSQAGRPADTSPVERETHPDPTDNDHLERETPLDSAVESPPDPGVHAVRNIVANSHT